MRLPGRRNGPDAAEFDPPEERRAWRRLLHGLERTAAWMVTPVGSSWALGDDQWSPMPTHGPLLGRGDRLSRARPGPAGPRPPWGVPQVRSLVDQLGATPGGVAAALYAMGVRGMPDAPVDPVGTYLHAVISADPDVESVVAGPTGVVVRHRDGGVEVPYPQTVQRFLAAFAAGWYPELHRGSWRTPSTP